MNEENKMLFIRAVAFCNCHGGSFELEESGETMIPITDRTVIERGAKTINYGSYEAEEKVTLIRDLSSQINYFIREKELTYNQIAQLIELKADVFPLH
jgi:hypothetical protein